MPQIREFQLKDQGHEELHEHKRGDRRRGREESNGAEWPGRTAFVTIITLQTPTIITLEIPVFHAPSYTIEKLCCD